MTTAARSTRACESGRHIKRRPAEQRPAETLHRQASAVSSLETGRHNTQLSALNQEIKWANLPHLCGSPPPHRPLQSFLSLAAPLLTAAPLDLLPESNSCSGFVPERVPIEQQLKATRCGPSLSAGSSASAASRAFGLPGVRAKPLLNVTGLRWERQGGGLTLGHGPERK